MGFYYILNIAANFCNSPIYHSMNAVFGKKNNETFLEWLN